MWITPLLTGKWDGSILYPYEKKGNGRGLVLITNYLNILLFAINTCNRSNVNTPKERGILGCVIFFTIILKGPFIMIITLYIV